MSADNSTKRVRIVISCGDVNGVGIECLAGALKQVQHESPLPANVELSLCIDDDVFADVLAKHKLVPFDIALIPIHTKAVVQPGVCATDAGAVAIASLNVALECVTSGKADALLTLPISKDACRQAGWPYPGHTELLAERARGEALMLLCFENVRVGLVTAHTPLRYVSDSLTVPRIQERIRAMHHALQRDFGIASPRIAVLGLNPHAGEHGLIGREEELVIEPAIQAARADRTTFVSSTERSATGNRVEGPFPADGFFAFGAYKEFDGILAMYHDQGLIPLKLLASGGGVNVTANLDIIRTSPDHGTAFDKAGRNVADSASTLAALTTAMEIVLARRSLSTE